MSQIVVSSGTTSVSTIDASNTYFVEGSGTLDILDGGLISSLVTVYQGGVMLISSGGTTLGSMGEPTARLIVARTVTQQDMDNPNAIS